MRSLLIKSGGGGKFTWQSLSNDSNDEYIYDSSPAGYFWLSFLDVISPAKFSWLDDRFLDWSILIG